MHQIEKLNTTANKNLSSSSTRSGFSFVMMLTPERRSWMIPEGKTFAKSTSDLAGSPYAQDPGTPTDWKNAQIVGFETMAARPPTG